MVDVTLVVVWRGGGYEVLKGQWWWRCSNRGGIGYGDVNRGAKVLVSMVVVK